jgi:hypothetical protein
MMFDNNVKRPAEILQDFLHLPTLEFPRRMPLTTKRINLRINKFSNTGEQTAGKVGMIFV